MAQHARRISRRQFVRRAGAAATAAGVTAAALAAPPTAHADPGDPLILGSAANDAGAAATAIAASGAGPTLRLQNPNGAFVRINSVQPHVMGDPTLGVVVIQEPWGWAYVGSDVAPSGHPPSVNWFPIMTTGNSSMTVATTPVRLLDTRTAAGRTSIVAGNEHIDSAGRLRGGRSIVLSLDSWVLLGDAVHLNLTVAKTAGRGYLTIWGVDNRPYASALNWWGAGQVISNGALSLLGTYDSYQSVVAIYASVTTAVVADLTGFDVGGPWQVNPDVLPGVGARHAVRKDAVTRSLAAAAARAAGGARHAAGPDVVAARRRPGPRALRLASVPHQHDGVRP